MELFDKIKFKFSNISLFKSFVSDMYFNFFMLINYVTVF